MKEKVVYITGAGFSAPLGLPLMSNFLEKSKDMFFINQKDYEHFSKVFRRINDLSICKNYYTSDLFNIEEILSMLEMNKIYSKSDSQTDFVKYIIDVINYYTPPLKSYKHQRPSNWNDFIFGNDLIINSYGSFVASLFNLCIHFSESREIRKIAKTYEIKLNENSKCNYSVVTLNYDRVLENFCGFITSEYTTSLDITFNSETENPEESNYNPYLAKLHGNVLTNKIIPPTWNKILVDKEIRKSWKLAHELLSKANHIRILGYSLPVTDAYIKYLFKSAVLKSKHLKSIDVICLDNHNHDVKNKYDDFVVFNKYRFVSADITEYLKQIFTKTKTLTPFNHRKHNSVTFDKLEEVHELFMQRNSIP
jgi:hypothetical protein